MPLAMGRASSVNIINHEFQSRMIGYKKLTEWNEIGNVDELIVQMIASKECLKQLLDYKILKDDWNFELLKIFAKLSEAQRSQNKISLLALLRGSQYISRHLSKSMLTWKVTAPMEKKVRVVKNLLQLIEVYFKMFPSSYNDMPLDELKNFAIDVNEITYMKKVSFHL